MTNGHYDFDEMVDCIYSSLETVEERKILYDITAHCLKCEKCGKIYDALYNVYELGYEPEYAKEKLNTNSFDYSMHMEQETGSDWEAEM